MSDTAAMKVEQLSKGNQQKIQLAATLLASPAIVILDEPLSGLDPIGARLVTGVIRELAAKGTTIVLSTHQMGMVEALCTRVFMIARGRGVLHGELRQIKQQYAKSSVRVASTADYRNCPIVERVDAAATPDQPAEVHLRIARHQRRVPAVARGERGARRELRTAVDAARGNLRAGRRTFRGSAMKKALLIAQWEFRSAVMRRAYLFAVIALPLLFGGIGAITALTTRSAQRTSAGTPIAIVDRAGFVDLAFASEQAAKRVNGTSPSTGLPPIAAQSSLVAYPDVNAAITAVAAGQASAVYVVEPDYLTTGQMTVYSRDSGMFGQPAANQRVAQVNDAIRASLLKSRLPDDHLNRAYAPTVRVKRLTVDSSGRVAESEQLQPGQVRRSVRHLHVVHDGDLLLGRFPPAGHDRRPAEPRVRDPAVVGERRSAAGRKDPRAGGRRSAAGCDLRSAADRAWLERCSR